jgi:protein TonB
VRCIDPKFGLAIAALAWLAGCSSPPPPGPAPSSRAQVPAPTVPSLAGRRVSQATSEKAYRVDADNIFKGKLPPMLYAIAVVETDVDANGNVRAVRMLRAPDHAPEVTARVRELIHKASPLPAPARLGTVRYVDTWLMDKSGKFQLDTLTEGQL